MLLPGPASRPGWFCAGHKSFMESCLDCIRNVLATLEVKIVKLQVLLETDPSLKQAEE